MVKGVGVSPLTPFKSDAAIDEKRLRSVVDFVIDKGVAVYSL